LEKNPAQKEKNGGFEVIWGGVVVKRETYGATFNYKKEEGGIPEGYTDDISGGFGRPSESEHTIIKRKSSDCGGEAKKGAGKLCVSGVRALQQEGEILKAVRGHTFGHIGKAWVVSIQGRWGGLNFIFQKDNATSRLRSSDGSMELHRREYDGQSSD